MSGDRARIIAFAVALTTLVAGAGTLQAVVRALGATLIKKPIEAKYKVQSVPAALPSWQRIGSDEQMSQEMVEELGTENYLSRKYIERNPPAGREPRVLDLHLAYYTGMIDTVPHVPERCMVGAGWSIAGSTQWISLHLDQDKGQWLLERDLSDLSRDKRIFSARLGPDSRVPNTRVNLPVNADQLTIRVNPYIHAKSNQRLYAGYFFIANGGHCPNAEDVRLLAFKLEDKYAFYLKVQISTASVTTDEQYAEACSSLLSELLPEIMLCVPDWPELERAAQAPGRAAAIP